MPSLLYLGEVLHELGRDSLKHLLRELGGESAKADLVVCNGNGILRTGDNMDAHLERLFESGIDVAVFGEHALSRAAARKLLSLDLPVIRPLNLPLGAPGHGWRHVKAGSMSIAIVSLFTGTDRILVDDPLDAMERFIVETREIEYDGMIVDFSGPNLNLKKYLAWKLSDRKPVVHCIGSGLGIPTDDLSITNGRLYITDIGMIGNESSIAGLTPDSWQRKIREHSFSESNLPSSPIRVDGVLLSFREDFTIASAKKIRMTLENE